MPTLVLGTEPGFTDIPTSDFDPGAPVTDSLMKSLNDNAKFGAVRTEIFGGFYKNGETVALPVSPADGYAYARAELNYSWSLVSTAAAAGALNGTQVIPPGGVTSGGGQLLQTYAVVDPATGAVTTGTAYYVTHGAQTNTTDGIVWVTVIATRQK